MGLLGRVLLAAPLGGGPGTRCAPGLRTMPGPHDLFARYTFSHPERAAAELRAVLPAELGGQVDWSSLHPESSSVVDEELRERQSDMLFSARLLGGQPLLLYFLFEHQSSVDEWMALRMLRYVVRQLEHWRHQHPEQPVLPIIVPMVLYHGPEGAWTAPRRMEELFNLPGEDRERWRAWVPRFEYLVDDLTVQREEVLSARPGPPLVPLALLLLRSGRSEKLGVLLKGWTPLLAGVSASPEGQEQLLAVVHYLLKVGAKGAREGLWQVLDSVVGQQRTEELMETMADEFIQQGLEKGLRKGLQEGLQKGRAEGRAEDVLRILAARGVAVDEPTRVFILSCRDLGTLDRWFDQALNAQSLTVLLPKSP